MKKAFHKCKCGCENTTSQMEMVRQYKKGLITDSRASCKKHPVVGVTDYKFTFCDQCGDKIIMKTKTGRIPKLCDICNPKVEKECGAICPKCEKRHWSSTNFTGKGPLYEFCGHCLRDFDVSGRLVGNGTKKKRIKLLSIIKTRGITREQKQRHDLVCEIEGRKFREQYRKGL